MLLASSFRMRKVLALVVVLMTSGLAPATVVIGFCARMPCCFGGTEGGVAIEADRADCCTTINCYETPPHDLAASAKARSTTTVVPVVLPLVVAVPGPDMARRAFDDTSPPPTTKQRLASLSILVI